MPKQRVIIFFLLSLVLLSYPQTSLAHEVGIHEQITRYAVRYLARRDTRFSDPDVIQKVTDLLLVGTQHEDDQYLPIKIYRPLGRYYFHFSPQLDDGLSILERSFASCSSEPWALTGPVPCTATELRLLLGSLSFTDNNDQRWDVALANKTSESGWLALGYVIHLLEDLTSPAHTRNDSHPHCTVDDCYFDSSIPD